MHSLSRTRTVLGAVIFLAALLAMVMPLPGEDATHLLKHSEANDSVLVILTTGDPAVLTPLIDQFSRVVQETMPDSGVSVHVEVIDAAALSPELLKETSADLILSGQLHELTGLLAASALDTLPPDLLWNIQPGFYDPARRWVGFTGRLMRLPYPETYPARWSAPASGNALDISAIALAQSSNSKPLAEVFLLTVYGVRCQRALVESTGEYSFLAFAVDAPAGLPPLSSLYIPPFDSAFDSDMLAAREGDLSPQAEAAAH